MTKEEIKTILRENDETVFYFIKKDGSERRAKGTLNPLIIEANMATPKGTGKSFDDSNLISYYDIEAGGWRSFKVENFIRIENTFSVFEIVDKDVENEN